MYPAQERILFTTPLLQREGSLSRRTAALLQREGSLSRKWGFLLQRKRFVFVFPAETPWRSVLPIAGWASWVSEVSFRIFGKEVLAPP